MQQDHELIGACLEQVRIQAAGGQIARGELERIVNERCLPARLYAPLMRSVEGTGTTVVDEQSVLAAEDENEDDGLRIESGWAVDGLGEFMRRSGHRLLTMAEEQALGERIDAGRLAAEALASRSEWRDDSVEAVFRRRVADGRDAEDALVRHNIRLVISLANKLRAHCTPAISFEDLIQEGYFGLARAVAGWEHSRGLKFSTYAVWWIRQTMERAIANQVSTIRLPVHLRDDIRKLLRVERDLQMAGEPATIAAVASGTGFSTSKVRDLRRHMQRIDSLDRLLSDRKTALGDLVADGSSEPEEGAQRAALREGLEAALECLNEREKAVMRLRYGLLDGQERTLEEVGREFGVTRERIRQIESKSLAKMRHPIRLKTLEGFLD